MAGSRKPGTRRKSCGIYESAYDYLHAVACGHEKPESVRIQAAKALLAYEKVPTPVGKKEQTEAAAKEVSSGVFATTAPPRLAVANA